MTDVSQAQPTRFDFKLPETLPADLPELLALYHRINASFAAIGRQIAAFPSASRSSRTPEAHQEWRQKALIARNYAGASLARLRAEIRRAEAAQRAARESSATVAVERWAIAKFADGVLDESDKALLRMLGPIVRSEESRAAILKLLREEQG